MSASRRLAYAFFTVFLATVARGDELWREDPVLTSGGLSSQDARNPGGLGWFSEVADNFDGLDQMHIDEVVFWGGYVRPPGQGGHPSGFTIRYYTDNGGHPGTRIFERDVLDTTETVFQLDFGGNAQYIYHSNLNPPFQVPGAGHYWLSVVAILDFGGGAESIQWGWCPATSVRPPICEQRFFSPDFHPDPNNEDVSFVLNGGVGQQIILADLNCDGFVNNFDIDPFVLALTDPAGYHSAFPNCNINAADTNRDGSINNFDIDSFVTCLTSGCQ